jgi:hypothetical protein
LYPDCVKIKPHWQLHVPDAIRRSGRILTCFGTERKSKHAKNIASFCYNKWSSTLLAYTLRKTLESFADPSQFQPIRLLRAPQNLPYDISPLLPAAWGRIDNVQVSTAIQCKVGAFFKNDVLAWQPESESLHVGRARVFFEIALRGGQSQFVALMSVYKHLHGCCWNTAEVQVGLVSIELFINVFPWVQLDASVIEALLPHAVK